jgi:CRP-like cAMP-binding protein
MLDSKIGLLENLTIFRGLSRKQLGLVVDVTTKAFFDAGENLITRDDPGDTGFLIMSGAARCLQFVGMPAADGRVGPGALLGEMAMLVDTVHTLTVQATERVRAVAIHREALRRAMQQDPAIAQQISDNLLIRLQAFAHDLRRFDGLLARAEHTGVFEANNKAAPSAGFTPRLVSTLLLPAEEKLQKFG